VLGIFKIDFPLGWVANIYIKKWSTLARHGRWCVKSQLFRGLQFQASPQALNSKLSISWERKKEGWEKGEKQGRREEGRKIFWFKFLTTSLPWLHQKTNSIIKYTMFKFPNVS
jgi:hypothetical protein